MRAEKVIKERRFTRRLRSEDGNKVVIEAGGGNIFKAQVLRQIRARITISFRSYTPISHDP